MKRKIKVLFIDDEKDSVEPYLLKMEQEGFSVFFRENGKDGIDLLEKNKPDIVITDILMAGGDGFYVLEKVMQDEKNKKIPVVALTNMGSAEDRKAFLDLGAKDYLLKTENTPTQVSSKIKEILLK